MAIMDINGAEESVLFSEVSSYKSGSWGGGKVSWLERCSQFRGVLTEVFHCTMQGVGGEAATGAGDPG